MRWCGWQGAVSEALESGSASSCAFRRADGASAVEPVAGMLISKPGRTGLFQVTYFVGTFCCVSSVFLCSLNQWELVLPDISLSSVWIILYSAFFSFASPAALVWISPLLAIYPTIDGLCNGKAFPRCLPVSSIFLQMSFSRPQIRCRCPAPTDQRF